MRRSFRGATVIVSGAAGGLGRALGQRFARAGSRVVLLDRDAAGVAAVGDELSRSGAEVLALPCDVTEPDACAGAVAAALRQYGRVDVLVNNAGITHRSAFASTETSVLRRVLEVNLFGAINLTRPALPHLQQSRGLIVAISSVAGYTPLIARTGYAASKHALHGFFESLRTELAGDGVDVMMVCPSFIATGIEKNALGPGGGSATHAQVVVGQRLQPDGVADRIFEGATRSRRLLLIGRTARAAWWVSRLAPSLYERIMARKLRGEMVDGG
jgi:NAD(P)-dependent dehydrogenase (short-subunit alcohol dehydrogenase family)